MARSGATADACVELPDAHAAHAANDIGCQACHACAGVLTFGTVTYPGGTTTAGGTIARSDGSVTCTVACHHPLGAAPQPVAWDAGPLACTACHTNVGSDPAVPVRSSHFAGGAVSIDTCTLCHDQSQHGSGTVRLNGGDGSSSGCEDCHDGNGAALGDRTAPVLLGWGAPEAGDFHGVREGTCRFDPIDASGSVSVGEGALPCPADQPLGEGALRITSRLWYTTGTSGAWRWTCDIEALDAGGIRVGPIRTGVACPQGAILNSACNNPAGDPDCRPTTLVTRGFGGSLRAPYTRGQGALPCDACHDFHSSPNAFLFAANVNGTPLPPGTIDRAGVGAQALCGACHEGERHEVCRSCHKEQRVTDGEYSWFEGAPVDPAPDGSPCFYCHGHEGILHMNRDPSPAWPGNGHPFNINSSKSEDACSHCHSAWRPPALEYAAPTLWPAPAVSGVTATSATVSWTTGEKATSWVEYGVGTASRVTGDGGFERTHSVTLTGLTPETTYVWRVRTSDVFRNVAITPLQTFTTPAAHAVPRPDLAQAQVAPRVGTYTTTTELVWFPVTAPSGTAVEYEVQLASDAAFTHLQNGSLSGPGVPGSTVGDTGWIPGTVTTSGGKPARSTPATITNIPQDECNEIVPNVYYWRVRARDARGNVSEWSPTGTFGAFAIDPWC